MSDQNKIEIYNDCLQVSQNGYMILNIRKGHNYQQCDLKGKIINLCPIYADKLFDYFSEKYGNRYKGYNIAIPQYESFFGNQSNEKILLMEKTIESLQNNINIMTIDLQHCHDKITWQENSINQMKKKIEKLLIDKMETIIQECQICKEQEKCEKDLQLFECDCKYQNICMNCQSKIQKCIYNCK